ncbi:MAG TPA: T9SS type A sorting domain-containing protein, partial [Saprospiraceae bacterium]|nr:T9SS type A sorting domain-containing protein [Saprospiraceae bacterium]
SDSSYILAVNFNSDNLPTDSVILTANAEVIGTFHIGDGHLLVNNFPVFPSEHTVILLCAAGAPDCCDVFEFNTPVCDGSCHIVDLIAATGVCTSDSTFVVELTLETFNMPGDSVSVFANDQFVGVFFNNPDFIRIEDFPLLPGETTVITVCASEAPDCCDTYTIENPSCGENCNIFDIVVDVLDCTSDTTFGAVISFQHENITNAGFDVWIGDNYLGFFTLEQIPVVSGSIPSNSSGNYNVTICVNDNSACCESLEFNGPVCGEQECQISNLEWSLSNCDDEGNFFFILDFDFINVGGEGFNVVGNGNNYGNFDYANVPIEIGPFPTDNTVYEFLVFDALDVSCFAVIVPGIVDCEVSTNEISHEGIFIVYNNGTSPGILALKDIQVSLFNSNGKAVEKEKSLSGDSRLELSTLPAGIYIGTVIYEGNVWPIKLVKSAY